MIMRYRAIGQDGRDGWYAMANVDWANRRAVGTLYNPPIRFAKNGSIARNFNVKVKDDGTFRIGHRITFRHIAPDPGLERTLARRAKVNMDRAVRRAVSKIKKKVEAI